MILIALLPCAAALVFLACDLRGRFANQRITTPPWPARAWCALIVGSYVAQLGVTRWAATHQVPEREPYSLFPFPIVDNFTQNGDLVMAVAVLVALVQVYALIGLYRAPVSRGAVAVGCALMALLSLGAPALASFDLIGYVHDAMLGRALWTPPPFLSPSTYIFDRWLGWRMVSLYGPLWVPLVGIMTAGATTMLAKVLMMRAFGLAFFLALLAAMRALGLPGRIIAVAALNPALFFEFVANGHNDMFAVAVVAIAAVFVRRQPLLATALVAVAGLVKLPYALLALPIFAAVRLPAARYAYCALAVAITGVLSWLGGGMPYYDAIAHQGTRSWFWTLWHVPAVLAVLVLLGVAIAGGRRYRSAVWLMPVLGSFSIYLTYPWYFIWGFPYALARRRIVAHLLVGFPLAATIVAHEYLSLGGMVLIYPFLVFLLCVPLDARKPGFAGRPE